MKIRVRALRIIAQAAIVTMAFAGAFAGSTAMAATAGGAAGGANAAHGVSGTSGAAHKSSGGSAATSASWDGYSVTGDTFTSVSAKWKVNPVTCNSSNDWAGFWIGFDGTGNAPGDLEQGGTDAQCTNGTPTYHLWWEMWPYNEVKQGVTVSPGDQISANVTYNPSSNNFTIKVNDLTSGASLSQSVACEWDQNGCKRLTADVISEDIQSSNGGVFPLPNYGTENYTNISFTDASGNTAGITGSYWQNEAFTQVGNGVTKQTTSATSSNGSAFSTTWQHV
ncbi:hypothetical protein ABIA31_008501 [Catenulispora sp. MAP5-51]|uniref:G1 family glutamic endopeptidase n=1 Tax=Catenulispora sp. MAP5-51 TaxID=3156298 RepID=UPI003514E938